MSCSKIRQYKCLLNFCVCCYNEQCEGRTQEKFNMEVKCLLHFNEKYFFKNI